MSALHDAVMAAAAATPARVAGPAEDSTAPPPDTIGIGTDAFAESYTPGTSGHAGACDIIITPPALPSSKHRAGVTLSSHHLRPRCRQDARPHGKESTLEWIISTLTWIIKT
eukprot:3214137-Pyramimonas_sp.AAC.1